jgi:hypothetical protein
MYVLQTDDNIQKRRYNKHAYLPRAAPNLCHAACGDYGGVSCGTPVDPVVVDRLIEEFSSDPNVTESMPSAVREAADHIFASIGSPARTLTTCWDIVFAMKHEFISYDRSAWN